MFCGWKTDCLKSATIIDNYCILLFLDFTLWNALPYCQRNVWKFWVFNSPSPCSNQEKQDRSSKIHHLYILGAYTFLQEVYKWIISSFLHLGEIDKRKTGLQNVVLVSGLFSFFRYSVMALFAQLLNPNLIIYCDQTLSDTTSNDVTLWLITNCEHTIIKSKNHLVLVHQCKCSKSIWSCRHKRSVQPCRLYFMQDLIILALVTPLSTGKTLSWSSGLRTLAPYTFTFPKAFLLSSKAATLLVTTSCRRMHSKAKCFCSFVIIKCG